MDAYPNAKIVLVEREIEAWFRSFKSVVLRWSVLLEDYCSSQRDELASDRCVTVQDEQEDYVWDVSGK
jgi:hypothetical protein